MFRMTTAVPLIDEPEPRQAAILTAAFEAFRHYGFRRSSMEDIAQAAGMSRAALYLHYRNKEDIFRSLVQHYFDWATAAVSRALAGDTPPEPALAEAFHAQGGAVVEALMASPHGAEFMDTKSTYSAEIVAAGEATLTAIYAEWLRRRAAAGAVVLDVPGGDAEALASVMMAALNGLKAGRQAGGAEAYAAYRADVDRLARLFGRALTPR